MALMAEHVVVIGQGRLLADAPVADLAARAPSLEDAFLELTGAAGGPEGPFIQNGPQYHSTKEG
jgi:hypothetical protein